MLGRSVLYLYELKRNLRLSSLELHRIQERRLKAILRHASENVPFYHRKLEKAKVKVGDVRSLGDLVKVPLTVKSEIQENTQEFIAKNVDLNKCIRRATSGSTGIPLSVFVDRNALDFENAVRVRAMMEGGLRFSDKTLIIADLNSSPKRQNWYQKLGLMRNKCVSIFDEPEKQLVVLEKYRPDLIKGYPSSLALLAHAHRTANSDTRPRLVFTGAELLDAGTRKLISSTFQAELLDQYGSIEFSNLAWECNAHSGYHMNVDSVLLEFVDSDGEEVAPGERGQIVCTSLVNHAMPLIRYKLDDIGVTVKEQCPCGRALPLMRVLEGRVGDFLRTTGGRLIPPTAFFPYPFEDYLGIKQFRIIQEREDLITIQLAVSKDFRNEANVWDKAKKEIQRLFGGEMNVGFQIVDKIPRDRSGKLRKIISRLNDSNCRHNSMWRE